MTDAFECDRCGELYGEPPALRVATNGIDTPAGRVNLKEKTRTGNGVIGGIPSPPETPDATYEINKGDLCEDCADEFEEFWGENDE